MANRTNNNLFIVRNTPVELSNNLNEIFVVKKKTRNPQL